MLVNVVHGMKPGHLCGNISNTKVIKKKFQQRIVEAVYFASPRSTKKEQEGFSYKIASTTLLYNDPGPVSARTLFSVYDERKLFCIVLCLPPVTSSEPLLKE